LKAGGDTRDSRSAAAGSERLRLGHIGYSNCFPVHARLLDLPREGDPALLEGVPALLNAMLEEGAIDVAPSSSIEYALHPERYTLLPDLVIGSRGAVRSIVLVSRRDPRELGGELVAIPTASATSVLLLKILLRVRWGIHARFRWFEQTTENPFAAGAEAALFIGDVALRNELHADQPVRLDLGLEWWRETELPFAFALWQAGSGAADELRRLYDLLVDSRGYGEKEREYLASRYARHFAMTPAALQRYWGELVYDLDEPMLEGLRTFYRLAVEIGELGSVPELRWID
jgi:chorismate dehydratase